MSVLAIRRFTQFVDDYLRGGLVWVSHAEINDVFTTLPRPRLEGIDDVKYVRGKSLDTGKLVHFNCYKK